MRRYAHRLGQGNHLYPNRIYRYAQTNKHSRDPRPAGVWQRSARRQSLHILRVRKTDAESAILGEKRVLSMDEAT